MHSQRLGLLVCGYRWHCLTALRVGFSDELSKNCLTIFAVWLSLLPPDEDVMTNEKLFFNLKTKERQIKSLHLEFHTVSTALIKLRDDYATVRTQCSYCCRYYKLKNIIETAIEATEAETRYER